MDYFGLDIGGTNIKIAWIRKEGKGLRLLSAGEVKNPTSGEYINNTKQQDDIAAAIKGLKTDLGVSPKTVIASIPENKVVSRMVVLPSMKDSEIIKALQYEAETFIPYPLKEVQIDYQVVYKDDNNHQYIYVVAAKNDVLEALSQILKKADLVPTALENNATALSRSLSPHRDSPLMIVEIGKSHTILIVVKDGNIYLTRIIPLGGEAFTRAVSLALGMDQFKAEEYKKAYGLKKGELKDKIRSALLDVLKNLSEEARKTMIAFEEEWGRQIDLIILSGGGTMIPELANELIGVLGVEVQWGNPFADIQADGSKLTIDLKKDGLRFSTVVGLAKRNYIGKK